MISWGSFLLGIMAGGLFFGFLGFLMGCVCSLLRAGQENFLTGLVQPIKNGEQLHGEFHVCSTNLMGGGGDDDEGDDDAPDPSPELSFEGWREN